MGPITPPKTLPVAVQIAGGLSPERTIFIDGGVHNNAKWFDITLQCGPSLIEEDDIAFRVILSFHKDYSTYTTNSSIAGVWDDAIARKKELIIKGLINKTENVDDNSLYNLSDLTKLLRCALGPQTKTNEVVAKYDIIKSFLPSKLIQTIKTDQATDNTDEKLPSISKMPAKSIRLIDTDQNKEISSQKPNKNVKSLGLLDSDTDKTRSPSYFSANNFKKTAPFLTLTEAAGEKSYATDAPTSTALMRSDQKEEKSAGKQNDDLTDSSGPNKQTRVRDVQEQVNTQVNEVLKENSLEKVPSKSDELVHIFADNSLKPVASEFIDPDSKAVRFQSDLYFKILGNLGKTDLLDEISISNLQLKEDFSEAELNEIELQPSQPFSMALECLENGYLMFLNGELFCVYPHHFDYSRVNYIVFNGDVDLELVEVGGGKGPDRTLIVDLYDDILWSDRVVVLTDENFNKLVLSSQEIWIVDAYTAWCPACQQLHPAWEIAAIELMGKINVGACDCERNEQLAEQLDVKYYPTVMCFPEGKKDIKYYRKYNGSYIANHIVLWALKQLEFGYAPNQTVYPSQKDSQKPGPKTLRKIKKPIRERRGYLLSGYGYVLRKISECPEHNETSSTKFIYASTQTEIDVEHKILRDDREKNPSI